MPGFFGQTENQQENRERLYEQIYYLARYTSMGFHEIFELPSNIRTFYLEMLAEEIKNDNETKNNLIKAWKKTGSVPPFWGSFR